MTVALRELVRRPAPEGHDALQEAIGRALMDDPALVLVAEPTS